MQLRVDKVADMYTVCKRWTRTTTPRKEKGSQSHAQGSAIAKPLWMTLLGPPLSSVASAHTSGLLLVLTRQSEACRRRRLILVAFVVSHAKWAVFEVSCLIVHKRSWKAHKDCFSKRKRKNRRVKLDMYCSHARESACVEGWCAKWAKRKQVDVICIVGSVNYKFILVQKKERRKERKKKKEKKRDLL